jgi:hypothetical protein
VRWSELPPRPRLVLALRPGEGALGESGSQKAAASIASERPWPGAPLVAGAAFEVVAVLAAASAKRPVLSLGPSSSIPAPRWLPHSTLVRCGS